MCIKKTTNSRLRPHSFLLLMSSTHSATPAPIAGQRDWSKASSPELQLIFDDEDFAVAQKLTERQCHKQVKAAKAEEQHKAAKEAKRIEDECQAREEAKKEGKE